MFKKQKTTSTYDAIVVGARPAGAATAMLLACGGARVLMVDRGVYGADTLSTHALMRPAVTLLRQWGLLDDVAKSGAAPVRKTTFVYGDEEIVVDIKAAHGVDALYAPRRTTLDRILADGAAACGVDVAYGVALTDLIRDDSGRVCGVRLSERDGYVVDVFADLVIGADGRRSTVAELVQAQQYKTSRHRTATVFGYFGDLVDDGYRWSYREGANIGAIPTDDGMHCVFALVPKSRCRETFGEDVAEGFYRTVAAFDPALAETLRHAPMDGSFRRFGGAFGHMRQSYGPGWALVGDAGYFKDPVTAHGLTDALRDAAILAQTVLTYGPDGLARYQQTRDALSADLFDVTDEISGFGWTLEELKTLHARLNAAMKAELAHLIEPDPPTRIAA